MYESEEEVHWPLVAAVLVAGVGSVAVPWYIAMHHAITAETWHAYGFSVQGGSAYEGEFLTGVAALIGWIAFCTFIVGIATVIEERTRPVVQHQPVFVDVPIGDSVALQDELAMKELEIGVLKVQLGIAKEVIDRLKRHMSWLFVPVKDDEYEN